MKRVLSGSFAHLAPSPLLRLLAATAPSGVLEISCEAGVVRLETVKGMVAAPGADEMRQVGRILRAASGSFRFEPREVRPIVGEALTLAALADAAEATERSWDASLTGDVDVARLLAGEVMELSRPAPVADIHVLPAQPAHDPLDELLTDLQATAPGELLLTEVVVISKDPRIWRGTLASEWRRRGWELSVRGGPGSRSIDGADAVILHQEEPLGRVDEETEWIRTVRLAREATPPVPVVWVGRVRDRAWVHRLIEAGVSFLMPAPESRSGPPLDRFAADLATVLDREMGTRQLLASARRPRTVYELVDTLLENGDPERAIGSLLQLASSQLRRGAVLMVEETAIRCRAGYGYPLSRGSTALPRGLALLEGAVRSGEPMMGIDPGAGGAAQLARVLGVDRLPAATAVIPLAAGAMVLGLLVADREGAPLPELTEMTVLACCLGGVAVRSRTGDSGRI
ncbi:MAG TPA: hypothetical protein PKJ99_17705 [Thermoanaerobaculales bacterium]|nr:hypothetical protein [Thermoanaerobaculales bacterium]HQL29790.1 hypothetical protein [Thermoanaerobaculales bacterium]HQN97110.1 hypothetical protein [Thermoanaerobaculales bacterium]HQP43369.1 hypothetical protein [Thermoanaerobaculales bacterium]